MGRRYGGYIGDSATKCFAYVLSSRVYYIGTVTTVSYTYATDNNRRVGGGGLQMDDNA